jgi:hypothetical protein
MRITLQVTSGPDAGRKVHLKSGQTAQIGRTEWADFSFPRDVKMAEVHFALECHLHGGRLRDLGSAEGTWLNGQRVADADVKHGDEITAGTTILQLLVGGEALDSTLTAAAVAGAAAEEASEPAGPPAPTAEELCEYLDLNEEAREIAAANPDAEAFLAALTAQKKYPSAIRLQAHLLPKREAVWWAHQATDGVCGSLLPASESQALAAAYTWVLEPSEEHRRAAETAAAATKYEGPGSWVALGAVWSGGSLAPPGLDEVPPDARLTGQALTSSLMIAAYHGDPLKAPQRQRDFLQRGQDIAHGKLKLPEK